MKKDDIEFIVDFLDKLEAELMKTVVNAEIDQRTISALFLANPKDDQLNQASGNKRKELEGFRSKLRHLRGVREEVHKGELEV